MPVGRPRAFDTEKALDNAINVFWSKGYEGTSLPDLTEAMGINRPSLYAAFGNKEALFRKALDRYCEKSVMAQQAMEAHTARAVVEQLLLGTAGAQCNPANPRGCLMVNGALASSKEADSIRNALALRRVQGEKMLCERLKHAVKENDFSAGREPETVARYVTTVLHGLAVQAMGGASRKQLVEVARMALKCLPV